jgi:GT2 family glycosyltransferase
MIIITIVVLCRNRIEYFKLAIKSIIEQNNQKFKILISDNSTNLEIKNIVEEKFPSIEYISWFPGISLDEHMRRVIDMVNTPYFVMFHDDDLLDKEYLNNILEQFENNPNAAAIGTNGTLIDINGKKIQRNEIGNKYIFNQSKLLVEFNDKKKLAMQYLSGDAGGVAPFSSYAYNKKIISGLYPEMKMGGNYFDTLFLIKILDRGKIIWINKLLVKIRTSHENVSSLSKLDYKFFINQLKNKNYYAINKIYIDEYRLLRIFNLCEKKKKKLPYPVIKFFIKTMPELIITSKTFRYRLIRKIIKIITFVNK